MRELRARIIQPGRNRREMVEEGEGEGVERLRVEEDGAERGGGGIK